MFGKSVFKSRRFHSFVWYPPTGGDIRRLHGPRILRAGRHDGRVPSAALLHRYKSPVERPVYGRAELRALKKGTSGRLQRPPELVPIPEYLLGTSGRLRKAPESCCILEKSRKIWSTLSSYSLKFWQNLRNFGKKLAI